MHGSSSRQNVSLPLAGLAAACRRATSWCLGVCVRVHTWPKGTKRGAANSLEGGLKHGVGEKKWRPYAQFNRSFPDQIEYSIKRHKGFWDIVLMLRWWKLTPPPPGRPRQVSTLAMVLGDRTYRPGVSISLSCHMFHPVAPGERWVGVYVGYFRGIWKI